jgi:hypothetical protein
MTTFLGHARLTLRSAFDDFKFGRDMVIGGSLAAATLALQVWWKLIPLADWREHSWQWIGSVVIPFVLVFGIDCMRRLVTGPWRLHQKQEEQIRELDAFRKSVEDEEVHLEPSNPLCSTFVTTFNWENGSAPGLSLRSAFTNNRKPGFPGKTAQRVKANITYFDGEREPFAVEGRWVRTKQPAAYSPLEDKTEILRVDFEPGTCHELDIANKMPFEPGCYAVAWDDLRARMLVGPIVKVKIELIAERVCQVFECVFETSEGKLNQLE